MVTHSACPFVFRVRTLLAAPAALVVQAAHRTLFLADQVALEGPTGRRLNRLWDPDGSRTEKGSGLDSFEQSALGFWKWDLTGGPGTPGTPTPLPP